MGRGCLPEQTDLKRSRRVWNHEQTRWDETRWEC